MNPCPSPSKFSLFFQRQPSSKFKLPRVLIGSGIIHNVLDIPSPFQNQCLQPFFTKLFGCPTSTDARTYDNRIVSICFIGVYIEIRHSLYFISYLGNIHTSIISPRNHIIIGKIGQEVFRTGISQNYLFFGKLKKAFFFRLAFIIHQ
ncbi:hypothetical protein B879_03432 [Cecembia lonarensis LW9]|uniref:Uncharacterized protein n=1 Tax=Cecembia lonarensis (strain CCUG 58316 / KCTC 22772 / LW9) TaxID=1225176 RepID=K1KZM1_CECL9|nr:hypothetical protein B879_03432 [Cecembia lonarensis LW9]